MPVIPLDEIDGRYQLDGEDMPSITGQQRCEYVVETGLWNGTWESLWNSSPTGELFHVYDMHHFCLAVRGHKLETVYKDGRREPVFPEIEEAIRRSGIDRAILRGSTWKDHNGPLRKLIDSVEKKRSEDGATE